MPLDQDLSKLTNDQILEKIQKLSNIVYSNNKNLAMQAYPLLMLLYEEQQKRTDKEFEEMMEKTNTKMDDIINIGE